jgi:hypothetical protein
MFNLFLAAWMLAIVWPKIPLFRLGGLGTPLRLEDILFLLLAVIFLVLFATRRTKFISSALDKPILIFLGAGLLSTLCGVFVFKTVEFQVAAFHFLRRVQYLGFFYFAYYSLTKLSQLRRAIVALLYAAILVGLAAYLQILNLFPIYFPSMHPTNKFVFFWQLKFVNSTFGGHYDLASFYLIIFSIGLAFLVFLRRSGWAYRGLFVLLFSLIPFYFTFGRSPLFGILVGLGVMLLVRNRKWAFLPLVLLGVVMVLFLTGNLSRYRGLELTHGLEEPHTASEGSLLFDISYQVTQSTSLTTLIFERYGRTYELSDPSVGPRIARWPLALAVFSQHPLLGAGYSAIGEGYDGDYIRMLAEVGICGMIAFFILIIAALRGHWWLFRQAEDSVVGAFGLGMLAATVGLLLNAVFIDVFEASKVAVTFWSLTGLSFKALYLMRKTGEV